MTHEKVDINLATDVATINGHSVITSLTKGGIGSGLVVLICENCGYWVWTNRPLVYNISSSRYTSTCGISNE